MPPQESTALLVPTSTATSTSTLTSLSSPLSSPSPPPPPPPPLEHLQLSPSSRHQSYMMEDQRKEKFFSSSSLRQTFLFALLASVGVAVTAVVLMFHAHSSQKSSISASSTSSTATSSFNKTGPYKLLERQVGGDLFQYYDFLDGPDSLGSAGYNVYVGHGRAKELDLIRIEKEQDDGSEYVTIRSLPGSSPESRFTVPDGSGGEVFSGNLRESIRLEGKRRFDRGLFLLDLAWMPQGCGVWPAFWLTDDDDGAWPSHGEIDIVEGVNDQTVAKTALHTSEGCSMYAHVPPYAHSGYWDSATGIPNTWTGMPDLNTSVPADNCWVMAAHQWANQGCVAISSEEGSIGKPFNERGGGVYALEWDPDNRYIKSWVFPADQGLPANLKEAIDDAASGRDNLVRPDPDTWGVPYAYFAIGESTGCPAHHFKNHRLIFNLAFCGNVAGNRFLGDCPDIAKDFLVTDQFGNPNPIATCNAYIESNPKELEDAYWKVRGVYVYERE